MSYINFYIEHRTKVEIKNKKTKDKVWNKT